MLAITEGLIGRLTTPAQRYDGASGQTEWLPDGVDNLEISFQTNRPVVDYGDFSWHRKNGSMRLLYLGVINPPSLSCSLAVFRGKRVE